MRKLVTELMVDEVGKAEGGDIACGEGCVLGYADVGVVGELGFGVACWIEMDGEVWSGGPKVPELDGVMNACCGCP